MKRKLLFFTVFAFVFFMTGCQEYSVDDEVITTTQTQPEEEEEEEEEESDDESESNDETEPDDGSVQPDDESDQPDDGSEPDSNPPSGKIYLLGQSINALADEGNFIWVVTDKKLIKWDKVGNEPTYFDLPEIIDGHAYGIKIDSNGLKWLLCNGIGLYQYDENQWIKEEFDFNNMNITGFDIDKNNNIWICTLSKLFQFDGINWTHHPLTGFQNFMFGLTADYADDIWFIIFNVVPEFEALGKYDGQNWTMYTGDYSGFFFQVIPDKSGNIWILTTKGDGISLVKFDGSTYTTICTLPVEFSAFPSMAIDNNGIFWIGTENGVVRYDGVNWTVFNNSNSALYSNKVHVIAVDEFNTKWVGTQNGLAALNDADLEGE